MCKKLLSIKKANTNSSIEKTAKDRPGHSQTQKRRPPAHIRTGARLPHRWDRQVTTRYAFSTNRSDVCRQGWDGVWKWAVTLPRSWVACAAFSNGSTTTGNALRLWPASPLSGLCPTVMVSQEHTRARTQTLCETGSTANERAKFTCTPSLQSHTGTELCRPPAHSIPTRVPRVRP